MAEATRAWSPYVALLRSRLQAQAAYRTGFALDLLGNVGIGLLEFVEIYVIFTQGVDMGDIQRLCERVLIVDHGALAYDGTLAGLVARVGAERVLVVDLAEPTPPLDDVPGTTLVGVEGGGLRQRLSIRADATTAAAVLAEVSRRADVRDLAVEEPDVEEVVRRLYAAGRR